jgi:hypothetical protein
MTEKSSPNAPQRRPTERLVATCIACALVLWIIGVSAVFAGCSSSASDESLDPGDAGGQSQDSSSPAPDSSAMDDTSTIFTDAQSSDSRVADVAAADSSGGDSSAGDSSGGDDAESGGPPLPPFPACGAVDGGDAASGPTLTGTITVSPATTLATIGSGFLGLSYEKTTLDQGLFRGDNAAAIALFRLLGPGVLRVGGNSVDRSSWNGNSAGTSPPQSNTSQSDVDALAAFAKAAGWTILYGVNMKTSTPAYAADESSYASGQLGTSLYGLEIGNEPDLYGTSYGTFKSQWEKFAAAIRAGGAGSMVPLTGPASAYNYNVYTVPFAADEGNSIVLLTHHYYVGDGSQPTATLDKLLAPNPHLITVLKTLQSAATSNGIANGYRCAECNSYYNGGASGVSDRYGTALWGLDFLFTNAQYGSTGVNFEGGGNGTGYTPIADSNGVIQEARPLYYAMLLFSLAGTGPMVETQVGGLSSLNFTAYAVTPSDGSTRVVLINKDATTTVHATIDVGKTVAGATLTRLEAPALDATSDAIRIGGAQVTPLGSWTAGTAEVACATGNMPTVDVAPGSAVLVRAK